MPDARATGERVLAALDRGRQRAIEAARARGAANAHEVRRLLDLDILAGHGERGRAGRIARRMRTPLTAKGVKKILERLSSGSVSVGSNVPTKATERT